MTDDIQIDRAVKILRGGGLVAFPTETVYGLGADATNAAAVERIFQVKGRPSNNPLIVHVANAEIGRRYVTAWPEEAEKLARAFWPGAITLVLPKAPAIVSEVSAGKSTVGVRAPNHPIALALLKKFDGPVAGPSANRSSRISPTTARHVRSELGDAVDLILDGGACAVGIESTVLDLTAERPVILRPGGISREQIEAVIGGVEQFVGSASADEAAASPGQHDVHYAPATPAYRFDAGQIDQVVQWLNRHPGKMIVVIAIDHLGIPGLVIAVGMPNTPQEYARRLYAALHEADAAGAGAIWIQMPPDEKGWVAVRDRIRRATRGEERDGVSG